MRDVVPTHSLVSISRRRLPRLLAAAALTFATGACSLFTVNVRPENRDSGCELEMLGTRADGKTCTASDAIAYAAIWRREFMDAAGEHSVARNLNAVVAFPAGAVAAFYGITGHGSTDRVARLALGSAMYYGASDFLAPKGKQLVYLEGALALSCVIDAGIRLTHSPARITELRTRVQQLERDVVTLRGHMIGFAGDHELMPDAVLARDDARNMASAAHSLINAHEHAGKRIASAVDRVVTQVAINATQQSGDLSSLLAMAGDLRGIGTRFGLSIPTPTPPAAKTAGQGQSSGGRRTEEEKELAEAILAVRRRALDVEALVTELALADVDEHAYELCVPAVPEARFDVSPLPAAMSLVVGKTQEFVVSNPLNNHFPMFTLVPNSPDLLLVEGPKISGGNIVFHATGKKESGGQPLVLTIHSPDRTSARTYQITVLPAPAAPATPNPPKRAATDEPWPPAGYADGFDKADIRRLQCHLGLWRPHENDGVVGPETYDRLRSFAQRNGESGDTLTQALFAKVIAGNRDDCTAPTR